MPVDEDIRQPAASGEEPGALEELSILTVRDTVLFPHAMLPITVGRPSSLALVEALGENRLFGVVSQLDPRVETPDPDDLYEIGTVAMLHKAIRVPKDNLLLFCEGVSRMRTREFTSTQPFLKARVERIPEAEPPGDAEVDALKQEVITMFQQIVAASPNLSDDLATVAGNIAEDRKSVV